MVGAPSRKKVLFVPETALVYDHDKSTWAQLLAPGSKQGWRKVPVKLGISNGQRTQITDGLKDGDKLVLP